MMNTTNVSNRFKPLFITPARAIAGIYFTRRMEVDTLRHDVAEIWRVSQAVPTLRMTVRLGGSMLISDICRKIFLALVKKKCRLQVLFAPEAEEYDICNDVLAALDEYQAAGVSLAILVGGNTVSLKYISLINSDEIWLSESICQFFDNRLIYKRMISGLQTMANFSGAELVALGVNCGGQAYSLNNHGIYIHAGRYYSAPLSMHALLMSAGGIKPVICSQRYPD